MFSRSIALSQDLWRIGCRGRFADFTFTLDLVYYSSKRNLSKEKRGLFSGLGEGGGGGGVEMEPLLTDSRRNQKAYKPFTYNTKPTYVI